MGKSNQLPLKHTWIHPQTHQLSRTHQLCDNGKILGYFRGFAKKLNSIHKQMIASSLITKNDTYQVFFVFLQREKMDCYFFDDVDVGDAAGSVSTDGACRT